LQLPLFQVDAFADRVFAGNPAAVVPLRDWLPDATMQAIALENNLSETAFLVGAGGDYAIRWFTPAVEVALCGHATLAAAWVVTERLEPGRARVVFRSREHGALAVDREDGRFVLDLPALRAKPVRPPAGLGAALYTLAVECHASKPLVVLLRDEDEVRGLAPEMGWVAALPHHGLCVTAPGRDCDFVSRYFVPASGVPEDPVTGSTHCTLVPFWAERLGKTRLLARQLSPRGGTLHCEHRGDRVRLGGSAVPYLEGRIEIPG
jgi:PhzF family phenazine biosynthesis protein